MSLNCQNIRWNLQQTWESKLVVQIQWNDDTELRQSKDCLLSLIGAKRRRAAERDVNELLKISSTQNRPALTKRKIPGYVWLLVNDKFIQKILQRSYILSSLCSMQQESSNNDRRVEKFLNLLLFFPHFSTRTASSLS